jgi:hypothetical protein
MGPSEPFVTAGSSVLISNYSTNENGALVKLQLAGENQRIREATLINCRFVHHKSKKETARVLKPGLCNDKPKTNRLSYETAYLTKLLLSPKTKGFKISMKL